MNTRFGHLNPDERRLATMSGDEQREQGGGSSDPEMSKMQLELRLVPNVVKRSSLSSSGKSAVLSTRLTPSEHKAYETLNKTVLEELKLSAGEYPRRSLTTRKRANEGWRPFATRIQSYLNFYLDARGVKTFDELVELLVAGQVKNNLSEGALRYVTLQEGNKWEKASTLSALLQTFKEAEGKGNASKKAEAKDAQFPYVRQEKGAIEPPKQGAAKQFGDKRAPRGCFACGALGHQKAKCPHGTKKQPSQAQSNANNSLSARVATEGIKGAHSELQPVTVDCLNSQIGAILDTGAEITVLRERAVPAELVNPHGTIGLVSAFGEKVSAKLAVVPLNIARETGVFAEIRETVPVLCALTDKLLSRTDCLLSREAWESLTTECDMNGLVTVGEEESTARAEIELPVLPSFTREQSPAPAYLHAYLRNSRTGVSRGTSPRVTQT
ncbi:hypothetical protein HPB48_020379 [Haemaphysalis longicornis]|uniref:CCHC-type domain-containing protein n=1 Tax=Haemaphysalis longicornis TaxID=44386 RepID=A0A9J6FN57_HAELO|nr:hypothetical protein HPB48_020379 [Haemaphysalis longicornis]